MRTFKSGATRSSDTDKIDPEAALSPLVLTAYCEYIRKHRLQGSQEARGDENWQLGIPATSYMKSLLRHVLEAWRVHRYGGSMNDVLFAVMFNTMGLLHERLKGRPDRSQLFYAQKQSRNYSYQGYSPIATTIQTDQLSGPHRRPINQKTKPVSSPQPTIYPDDWPSEG